MANTVENELETLSATFKQALDLYNNVTNSQAPTNSPEIQLNVRKSMSLFENATRMVSLAGIFSKNEDISDMTTSDIQYLLLPALLGSLSLKLTGGERKDIVNAAEVYFKDFLIRCSQYGLSNFETALERASKSDEKSTTEIEQLTAAVSTRATKIQRFTQQKELREKLSELKTNMENEHVDEEIKRNYFLTMIRLFILDADDELNTINMEKPILEHIANMKKDEKPTSKRPYNPTPLRPIIITRDEVQKAVYGAGYPSLATMTVQEFYDKRVADGVFPDPEKRSNQPMSLQQAAAAGMDINNDDMEKEQEENRIERDDDENIARMRARDEFKDEHRRGWGNRMNRS